MKTNTHFRSISLNYSKNEKCLRQNLQRNSKPTFYVQYLLLRNRAVYEIMWKITVKRGRPQVTIWRMRYARWVPKSTNTQTGYVIVISFALQLWWNEHASVLCYTYIACLVIVLTTSSNVIYIYIYIYMYHLL